MTRRWGGVAVVVTCCSLLGCAAGPYPERYVLDANRWLAHFTGFPATKTLTGNATYYHDSLSGNGTANGERYDPRVQTAAHRSLPFGTVLRVTRTDTGDSVIVRVNDRGPFGRRDRILDLSRAAAAQLRMLKRGVVPIRAEIVWTDTRR